MKDMRLWVDLETTGLDENRGGILELGLVLTDKLGNNIEAEGEWLINPYSDVDVVKAMCNATVREMHTKNGLLEELEKYSTHSYASAQTSIEKWMMSEGIPSSVLPMCGSSVHFDRTWMKKYLPAVENMFTYRNIDVSTLRELCKDLNPAVYEAMSDLTKNEEHRALPDLEDTIGLYKFMLDNFLFVAV